MVVFDAEIETDGVNTGFTVIVRVLLVMLHDASLAEVTTTLILSKLLREVDEMEFPVADWLVVPINHSYSRFAPPVGVAVKVTSVPAQIVVPGFAEILTEVGHCPNPLKGFRKNRENINSTESSFFPIVVII